MESSFARFFLFAAKKRVVIKTTKAIEKASAIETVVGQVLGFLQL